MAECPGLLINAWPGNSGSYQPVHSRRYPHITPLQLGTGFGVQAFGFQAVGYWMAARHSQRVFQRLRAYARVVKDSP